jgi:hypothetical protein
MNCSILVFNICLLVKLPRRMSFRTLGVQHHVAFGEATNQLGPALFKQAVGDRDDVREDADG